MTDAKKQRHIWYEKDYARDPKKYKERQWQQYGVITAEGNSFTLADYDRAYQIQQGRCKLCGIHQSDMKCALSVDHSHVTKLFRGLLCRPCNSVLGLVKEQVELLEKMKMYLEK